MSRYIARRIALIIPTAIVSSMVVFAVMRVLPGDVALAILADTPHTVEMRETLREELGLNEPLFIQYLRWIGSIVSDELGGRSLETGERVRNVIAGQMSVTALLSVYAVLASVIVSVPVSVLAALRRGRWLDNVIQTASRIALSVPTLFAALLLVWLLLRLFGWSAPIIYSGPAEHPREHLEIMLWPVVLLTLAYAPHIVRVTRARLLDVLGSDYAESARARGIPEARVVVGHALPNAAITVITVVGLQVGVLISGDIVVEVIFGLPGIGRGIVRAALARDYPVVQSSAMVLVVLVLFVNFAVDVAYAGVDPRVRYGRRTL